MKKTLFIIIAMLMMVVAFAGCSTAAEEEQVDDASEATTEEGTTEEASAEEATTEEATTEEASAEEEVATESESEEGSYEIAMITDAGEIDDKSFNQSTWEGIVEYAEENGISYKYYKPLEVSDDAYIAAIDLAVNGGAKIVVCPGYLFGTAIYTAQDIYTDTSFVLIDEEPNNGDSDNYDVKVGDNVYSIKFKEEQCGFLAGIAAVKEGYTKIGFMGGMAVPAVIRYGYGFVQGAEYAAAEMGLDSVELNYYYTGDFADTPENQTMASSWYGSGTEVIFAAGGKVGNSVMSAAEAAEAAVIGVDVDQSGESDSVITSATKELGVAVKAALVDFYADSFKGGVTDTFDITIDGVGLIMDTAKFETFTQEDFDEIKAMLVGDVDGVTSGILDDSAEGIESPTDLETEIVTVTFVE